MSESSAPERPEPRRSDIVIVVALFAVLFGYDVLEAITNLQQLPVFYDYLGIGDAVPWVLLVAGIVAPPVLFAAAMAVGRGRSIVARAGILLVGLGVSAQLALLCEELARQVGAAALG